MCVCGGGVYVFGLGFFLAFFALSTSVLHTRIFMCASLNCHLLMIMFLPITLTISITASCYTTATIDHVPISIGTYMYTQACTCTVL